MSEDSIEEIGRTKSRSSDNQVYSTRSTPTETKVADTKESTTLTGAHPALRESTTELSREAQQSTQGADNQRNSATDFRNSWLDALNGRKKDDTKEPVPARETPEKATENKEAPRNAAESKEVSKNAAESKEVPKNTADGKNTPEKAADNKEASKNTADAKDTLAAAGDFAKKGLDMAGLPALGDTLKNNVLTNETANDMKKLIGADGTTPGGNSQSTFERALNLAKLGLDIPELRKIGTDVKENGFSKENVDKLKELLPDIKNVITPENMKLLKDIKPDALDKVFTPEVQKEMKEKFPKLAEKLNFENMDNFKKNLSQLQSGLTKDNIASVMNQLAPWVGTSQSEGTLDMLDRMVGDPTKLGGGDKKLSTEDFTQIARGVLNTQTGQQLRDNMLLQNVPEITHSLLTGRELQSSRRIERRLDIARGQATPERISSELKNRQNIIGSAGLPDSPVPRSFTEQEVQSLIDAGKRAQQMGFGPANGCQGQNDQERINGLMSQVMEPLKRSVSPENGISQEEIHNIARVGNMAYDVLGSVYVALGGQYK